ncbi:MAG TPA: tRNA glutamyl-Q(34) synthetase GluQRS [Rubricoccaceae bacterium]
MLDSQPVGRFAPSPTGDLHVGSALAALAAWASARAQGGRFVVRIEDLDGPRVVPGASERQLAALRRLGLAWDGPVVRQSRRGAAYDAALVRLAGLGQLFACRRSRADLAALASAPHSPDGPPYPAAWRTPSLGRDALAGINGAAIREAAIRFRVEPGVVRFSDRVQGEIAEDVASTVGDVVLRRRDGVVAYQLAVVVDDAAAGVTEVVRGADLLGSTARQIQIARALGVSVPAYAHVPLIVAASGEKLSKRDGALSVDALLDAGVSVDALVGWLAGVLGQGDAPRPAAAVAEAFDWPRVPRGPVVVADDLAAVLRG